MWRQKEDISETKTAAKEKIHRNLYLHNNPHIKKSSKEKIQQKTHKEKSILQKTHKKTEEENPHKTQEKTQKAQENNNKNQFQRKEEKGVFTKDENL